MEPLSTNRPIFHSERDFQLALAWKIHEMKPNCGIRLEVPFQVGEKRKKYMDIQFQSRNRDQKIAIELKYRKQKLCTEYNSECFDLPYQAAQDSGCHGFIKDVQRLEQLLETENQFTTGFAVFLTNDPRYWESRGGTNYDDFHIGEGKKIAGEMKGKKDGEDTSICLKSSYDIHWHNYSHVGKQEKYGRFRYLVVEVVPSSGT